jgi:CRISPR-associated endonuclease Csn1
LTDEYIKEIKNAIFYQTEKLIPESGYFPYFKNEKRLFLPYKLNEYRKMYETLSNARYFAPVLD